jgi:hypothetical protein
MSPSTDVDTETNHKNIPPPRPLLHIPPLPVHDPHVARMGLRIRRRLHANITHNHGLYIRTLLTTFATHSNTILLPRRTTARTRELITARSSERIVQLERGRWWERRAGIWILLGCRNKSVCTSMGVPLRRSVLVHAADRNGSLVRTFRRPSNHNMLTRSRPSELLSNTIFLFALNYYFIITFLGYNALPFLHHTELLLAPIAVTTILWFASLFGFNMSRHFAPVLWAGARLRKHV